MGNHGTIEYDYDTFESDIISYGHNVGNLFSEYDYTNLGERIDCTSDTRQINIL